MIVNFQKTALQLFVALYTCYAGAQELVVIDNSTLQPVPGAVVSSLGGKDVSYTDQNGKAHLADTSSGAQYRIFSTGYIAVTVTWDDIRRNKHTIALSESGFSLEEIVVSASKFEEKKKDVAQNIRTMNKSELERLNQSSTADVLNNQGNIFVQKSQLGGGSPVIRGFETNKILLVVDGVRMNNAIYRGGHLQNVITLDNSVLDKVEVVFGPGSVVYGSDALGGVVHFYTKNPLLSTGDKTLVKANAFARYNSASSGYSAHADVSVGGRKVGSLSSFTYAKFDDLRQGSNRNPFYPDFGARTFYVQRINGADSMVPNTDPDLQIGSGYTQYDILQKLTYKPGKYTTHQLNMQYSTSSDIPRYDRLVETSGSKPKFAEWYYGPQDRALASYNLLITKSNRVFDHAKLIAAAQHIEESRVDRRFGNDNKNYRIEKVNVLSLNLDFDKLIGKQELRFGAEANANKVGSAAFQENIKTGIISALNTRYPDGGATVLSAAVYGTHAWEIGPRLVLNDGIRLSHNRLRAEFKDKSFFPFPFAEVVQNNTALNGNLGLIYTPLKSWRFVAAAGTAFRSPNVDDLAKVFESVSGKLIVPNPTLKPEYSYNAEVGIAKTFNDNLCLSVTGYYTWINNIITTGISTFGGEDSILYDGQLSQVITSMNKGNACIYGVEASLKGNITDKWQVFSTINYTYGRIQTDTTDYPLDHIPPVYGRVGFGYNAKRIKSDLFVQYSGWKKLEDYNLIGEDNSAFATAHGMPAWYTLNARIGYQFSKYVNLQVACENILDANYRMFASNISAPGRNFIATVRFNL